MQIKEFKKILEKTGLPVAYRSYPKGKVPPLPYLLYYFPDNSDLLADNINYVKIADTNIELYTKNKDFEVEENLENILNASGFFYEKSEAYLNTEEMYEVLYEIRLIQN